MQILWVLPSTLSLIFYNFVISKIKKFKSDLLGDKPVFSTGNNSHSSALIYARIKAPESTFLC